MTLGGWIFMSTSVSAVVALAIWCYYRVLRDDPRPSAAKRDSDDRG